MNAAIAMSVITVVLLFYGIYLYNNIVKINNLVIRSWADIVAYEREKVNLFPQLLSNLKEYYEHESTVQVEITKLRSHINDLTGKPNVNKLKTITDLTKSCMGRFNYRREDYPNLTAYHVTKQVLNDITTLEKTIAAAITIFNMNVADFNSYIKQFPNNVVNSLTTGYKRYSRFDDSSYNNIEYKFRQQ
jgi:LemA protein